MPQGIHRGNLVVQVVIDMDRGVRHRVDGRHHVSAVVVFMDDDVPESIGDGLAPVLDVVREHDRVAVSIRLANQAAGLIVFGADGADAARVEDVAKEMGRWSTGVLECCRVGRAVREADQITVCAVRVSQRVACGIGDVGNTASGIAGELNGLARAVIDPAGRVLHLVAVEVHDLLQPFGLMDDVGRAVGGGEPEQLRVEIVAIEWVNQVHEAGEQGQTAEGIAVRHIAHHLDVVVALHGQCAIGAG